MSTLVSALLAMQLESMIRFGAEIDVQSFKNLGLNSYRVEMAVDSGYDVRQIRCEMIWDEQNKPHDLKCNQNADQWFIQE